jgi:outer membrane protein OmpA-like peptidoglycan-associated protein
MKDLVRCLLLASVLGGCASAPPAPPMPDEATRRPANSGLGIELQTCQANLANSRLVLEEDARAAGSQAAGLVSGGAAATDAHANTVYIIPFRYAERQIRLSEEDVQRLVADAKLASGIQVRGRTDASRETGFDNALAAGRTSAVFALLVAHGVDPAKIRMTYQGQGDGIAPNIGAKSRALNRRAEVEMYRLPPQVVIFANR